MTELTPDLIKDRLKGSKKKDLHELILQLDALEKRLNLAGPQTDDELHQWIVDTFDINIPRVSVCEGHQSPFNFLADLFFCRTTSALAMASRGGSKTFLVALLHRLNGEFKAGVEALTVGATMPQSQRCFAHLDKLISIKGENNIRSKMKTEVVWNNGTKAEIVPGSPAAVNGPHPHIMHIDEAEIMDPFVFDESRNCAQSGMVKGKLVPAQDIITSTRKYSVGKMQSMVDEVHEAKLKGHKPLYDLYTWCSPWYSLVDCPRDRNLFPDGVPIAWLKPGQLVWSINEITQEFELKPVKRVVKTAKDKKVWRVILDSGDAVRATAEHPFMLRDGSWLQLQELRPGMSLMPLYADYEPQYKTKPNSASNGTYSEFRAIRDSLGIRGKDNHIHHVDGWRCNTDQENLIPLTVKEHHLIEWMGRKERARKLGVSCAMGDNDTRRESVARGWAESNETEIAYRSGRVSEGLKEAWKRGYSFPEKSCRSCQETFQPRTGVGMYCEPCRKKLMVKHGNDDRVFTSKECIDCAEQYTPRSGNSIRCDDCRFAIKNHVIVAIEPDGIEDVWDIEVEDNHNFVVQGVVVHNCIFEVAQPNKGCKVADPTNGTCECQNVVKGEWHDGSDRTLMDVCNGKFARSDGWIVWDDIVNLFVKNSREVWEAQQECSRPETTGLVLPHFSTERNGILNYQPDPDNGPIYQGIDFGSTNPNAVLWWQVLKFDVEATSINGMLIVLKEGSRVCFDEFYQAEIPNPVLARNIIRRERLWKEKFPKFYVKGRFADPQGAQARRDLANNDPPIRTTWHTSRDVRDQIKIVKELIEDKKFYVDTQRVPMLVDELGYWHYPKIKAQMVDDPEIPVDDFDHSCSAMRYALCNIKVLEDDATEKIIPGSIGRQQETYRRLDTMRRGFGGSNRLPNTEKWRLGLGGPFSSDTRGRF